MQPIHPFVECSEINCTVPFRKVYLLTASFFGVECVGVFFKYLLQVKFWRMLRLF